MKTAVALKKVSIEAFVECLRQIMPPDRVIHIGAGTGQGFMNAWQTWGVSAALIVDANEARLAWAHELQWQVHSAVLAQEAKEVDFFTASNPNEDGLISPEQLVALWPNLRSTETLPVQTQTLDHLVTTVDFFTSVEKVNLWLMIDCLSSLAILKGATHTIEKASVLWLRVLLEPLNSVDAGSLQEIDAYLNDFGYRCVSVVESNHPRVGEAIFVRDWQDYVANGINEKERLDSENAALRQARDEQHAMIVDQQQRLDAITQEREQVQAQLNEKQFHIDVLASEQLQLQALQSVFEAEKDAFRQERDHAQAQINELNHANSIAMADKSALENLIEQQSEQRRVLQHELLALAQSRDEQTHFANERQHQLESLTAERDFHAAQHNEKQAQLDALTHERAELFANQQLSAETLANVTQSRDEQTHLANERQAQIEQISNERDQQAQLAVERMQQIEVLTNERDANVNLANERQAQIEQVSNESNQLAQFAAERMQQIEVLTHERDEFNVQRNTLENKCRSIEQSVEKLATQEMQLTSELAQAKQTIALSIKLQTLKETDLRDLQQRYQAALSVQENQHKLLVQLSERLTLAADYFHKMSEQDAIVREEVPKIQKKSWWLGFFKGRDSV